MKNLNSRNASLAVAFVLLALVQTGCRRPEAAPEDLIAAIDVSCQEEASLVRHASAVYRFGRQSPNDGALRTYVFGHGADLVYSGPKLRSRGKFNQAIGQQVIRSRQGLLAAGTQTDLVFERIAADVGRSSRPVRICLATDGGMEDQGRVAKERLQTAIAQIAASKNLVSLQMVNVLPQFRSQWEELLRPLGNRGYVLGTEDAFAISSAAEAREVSK